MRKGNWSVFSFLTTMAVMLFLMVPMAFAGEADIKLPDLSQISFMGGALSGMMILNLGLVICFVGMIFGWMQYIQTKNLPAHQAMLDVSQTIWETCKTYVLQQGKFLAALWVLIAICMIYYFGVLSHTPAGEVVLHLRYPRILWCRLVRYPDQHRRQLPRCFCISQRRSAQHRQHLSAFGYERRSASGQHRAFLHDHHPGLHPQGTVRPLLHRFRHW